MKSRSRQPSFFKHGILQLLPTLALAAIGALSLWKDRRGVEAEERERARNLAQKVAAAFVQEVIVAPPEDRSMDRLLVSETPGLWAFLLDDSFRLLQPSGFPAFPPPLELDPRRLTAEQRKQWDLLQAQATADNCAEVSKAAAALVENHPPDEFAAIAHHQLALGSLACGDTNGALAQLETISNLFSNSVSKAGLPLAPLALLKQAEILAIEPRINERLLATALERLAQSALDQPSMLSERILERAGELAKDSAASGRVVQLRAASWKMRETTRALFAAFEPAMQAARMEILRFLGQSEDRQPAFLWLDQSGPWLAQFHSAGQPAGATLAIVRKIDDLNRQMGPFLERQAESGFSGLGMGFATSESGPDGSEAFARAVLELAPAGPRLETTVNLLGSDRLFARQRQRAFWFALLIVAATGASVIGLLAARRAFLHQARLNELKSGFVSSVSHELRAPIGSVRLLAESLERGKIQDPEKQREYFGLIVHECRRLGGLIENVLDFARIEQGRKEYEFELTDCDALIQQTAALMQPQLVEKQVRLEIRREGAPAPIMLDGRAVQRALINLLDNAVKHSPAGAAIGIEAACAKDSFTLAVEDRGPGIPALEQRRVFERFYRLGSELRRETQGVGIGLSIVQHIMEAHGGSVRVESEVGKGSRFVLEFPIRHGEAGHLPQQEK